MNRQRELARKIWQVIKATQQEEDIVTLLERALVQEEAWGRLNQALDDGLRAIEQGKIVSAEESVGRVKRYLDELEQEEGEPKE